MRFNAPPFLPDCPSSRKWQADAPARPPRYGGRSHQNTPACLFGPAQSQRSEALRGMSA